MKSFACAMHFPPIVKYIDTIKHMDARTCDTIVSDSGAGASISETRVQPHISVLLNSNSMHSVTLVVVQSCAAGARMKSEVDTSEGICFGCSKGCGRIYERKDNCDRHHS